MRVLIQRVLHAEVTVASDTVGAINAGLLLFAGFTHGDDYSVVQQLSSKILNLRIFPDSSERLMDSVIDVKGEILAVPQFTLYASTRRGRRPDFGDALSPNAAKHLFSEFVEQLSTISQLPVASGVFGAQMQVHLENDGPFTMMLSSDTK